MDFYTLVSILKKELKEKKPGITAQLEMAPQPRPGQKLPSEVKNSCIKAGVLVLLFPVSNQAYLTLTRRTPDVFYHRSQISFPGGRRESNENLKLTALRETREELNIKVEALTLLGELTPLYIPPSNHCIYPLVAASDKHPKFMPQPSEVSEVLEVPLDHLMDPDNVHREIWTKGEVQYLVPYYLFKQNKIWGATAMVIAELLAVLRPFYRKKTIEKI